MGDPWGWVHFTWIALMLVGVALMMGVFVSAERASLDVSRRAHKDEEPH